MDIQKQIKLLLAYAGITEAELARRLNTTPPSLNKRLQRGKLTPEDLQEIAAAAGAEYISFFRFPDGSTF